MDGMKKILKDIETNVYHSSQQKTADWLESILKKYNIKIKPKMDRKLIESHFKLFRKVIQLQNFYKNIKEKGTSKGVINLEELDDIINEAREINKHYSEFPESEKLKPQRKQMKPTHVKPSFYAFIYEQLKDISKEYGYNLVLHGSMNRDLDLIAIAWTDNPKPELELVHKMDETINEVSINAEHKYQFSVLPGGRNNYVINICRGGEWNKYQDANFYLDISFTPNVG